MSEKERRTSESRDRLLLSVAEMVAALAAYLTKSDTVPYDKFKLCAPLGRLQAHIEDFRERTD